MVWIVDNNDLQATSRTQDVMTVEPVHDKFAAFGCHARRVDGHSIPDILDAFAEARTVKGKPYVMVLDTRLFAGIDCLNRRYPVRTMLPSTRQIGRQVLPKSTPRLRVSRNK